MKILRKIKNLLISFENLLSGEHSCLGCGIEIADGSEYQICEKCLSQLEKIEGDICTKCGEQLIDGMMFCEYCENKNYNFDFNHSFCYYGEVSANIVKALKYDHRKYYSKYIAKMMTKNLSLFEDIDYLTYVPMTEKRKKRRGFNQAEEIAKEISKIIGIPVFKFLNKSKDHKNQARLNQKDRLENLKDTFEINLENSGKIKDKNILIIDDVFTTGATLSECSKVLKSKKPKTICTYTFAKTKLVSLN